MNISDCKENWKFILCLILASFVFPNLLYFIGVTLLAGKLGDFK
jgi:hypothetical protein